MHQTNFISLSISPTSLLFFSKKTFCFTFKKKKVGKKIKRPGQQQKYYTLIIIARRYR